MGILLFSGRKSLESAMMVDPISHLGGIILPELLLGCRRQTNRSIKMKYYCNLWTDVTSGVLDASIK